MKIEKVDPKDIDWAARNTSGKWSKVYEEVRALSPGECIVVTLDGRVRDKKALHILSSNLHQNFRKGRADFHITCRCLNNYQLAVFKWVKDKHLDIIMRHVKKEEVK